MKFWRDVVREIITIKLRRNTIYHQNSRTRICELTLELWFIYFHFPGDASFNRETMQIKEYIIILRLLYYAVTMIIILLVGSNKNNIMFLSRTRSVMKYIFFHYCYNSYYYIIYRTCWTRKHITTKNAAIW